FQAEDGIRDFHVTGVQTLLFRSGRDSLFGQSPWQAGDRIPTGQGVGDCASAAPDQGNPHGASWCENDGFYTDFSWGYRLRAALDYSNVIAGINLSPNIAWSHDVEGY